MTFEAELKQTRQAKAVSLDNVYTLTFATDNPLVMDLGKLDADTTFTVTVEIGGR